MKDEYLSRKELGLLPGCWRCRRVDIIIRQFLEVYWSFNVTTCILTIIFSVGYVGDTADGNDFDYVEPIAEVNE